MVVVKVAPGGRYAGVLQASDHGAGHDLAATPLSALLGRRRAVASRQHGRRAAMKAPEFGYVRPQSLQAAIDLLAHDEEALPLAGGQSLLASLNLRLSTPSMLVDISRLAELKGIALVADSVRIGALARHVDIERSPVVAEHLPLLKEAMYHVAHAAIRNRGTIGGSFAHYDPAAELPACAVALDATIVLASRSGRRDVRARDFFRGVFETSRQAGELIVEVRVPRRACGQRSAFMELSRRHGDFAMVGLAAVLQTAADGQITQADFVYFGASQPPLRSKSAAEALRGQHLPLDDRWIEAAVAGDLDLTGSAGLRPDTKLKLAAALTRRVLNRLAEGDEPRASSAPHLGIAASSSRGQRRPDGSGA